jgi:branched-chain amino acid transport system substrate-binding protein
LVVPIATGDKIKETTHVFMISPRNEKQSWKIFDFIKKEGINKVGCLFKQNDYGVNIAYTFMDSISKVGIETYSQAYQEGQNDFKSLLRKFEERGFQTIFIPGNYEETALILKQSKELAQNITFIGTDGCYSPDLIQLAGTASEGFLLTMMPLNKDSELYKHFLGLYKAKKSESEKEPDVFTCYGYETFCILFKAIENATNQEVKEVSDYLMQNKFNSLTDTLNFDAQGEAVREYKIYEVKKGEFTPTDK